MDLLALAPELLVCLTALLVIIVDLFDTEPKPNRLAFVAGLGLSIALGMLVGLQLGGYQGQTTGFAGHFSPDAAGWFFRLALLIAALLTVMLAAPYVEQRIKHAGEFYALICLATLGALFLSATTHILTLYLALELLSISSFVLVALRKDQPRSAEAAIKYLIFGAVSSGLLLYGLSLLFGLTGSLNYAEINTFLQQNGAQFVYPANGGAQSQHLRLELMISLLMILGGLSYKIAAVPFHLWAPDVYEGAPLPVTAFLSASSKLAGFAALMRILEVFNVQQTVPIWATAVAGLAALSMTYGNVVAIAQQNIKRLFAYSSIAHAGYLLMGVLALSEFNSRDTALVGLMYYLLVYVFMNLGAFAAIVHFAGQSQSTRLQDWSGLGRRHPWYGFVLACCLLSLTGLPPFAGFTGKFYLFGAVTMMGPQYLWLVAIGVLNSVLSLYYYSRIIRVLFFGQPGHLDAQPEQHPALLLASIICLVGIIGLFIFPNWVISFVSQINTLI